MVWLREGHSLPPLPTPQKTLAFQARDRVWEQSPHPLKTYVITTTRNASQGHLVVGGISFQVIFPNEGGGLCDKFVWGAIFTSLSCLYILLRFNVIHEFLERQKRNKRLPFSCLHLSLQTSANYRLIVVHVHQVKWNRDSRLMDFSPCCLFLTIVVETISHLVLSNYYVSGEKNVTI